MINAVVLPRLEAIVAGRSVIVENTYTRTNGYNLVTLQPPTIYDGTNATVKRTDLLFLEAWQALVAPSPRAEGSAQVADVSALQAGDRITINGLNLTAAAAPAANSFVIGATEAATAQNIMDAINLSTNQFASFLEASINPGTTDIVTLRAVAPGAATGAKGKGSRS